MDPQPQASAADLIASLHQQFEQLCHDVTAAVNLRRLSKGRDKVGKRYSCPLCPRCLRPPRGPRGPRPGPPARRYPVACPAGADPLALDAPVSKALTTRHTWANGRSCTRPWCSAFLHGHLLRVAFFTRGLLRGSLSRSSCRLTSATSRRSHARWPPRPGFSIR